MKKNFESLTQEEKIQHRTKVESLIRNALQAADKSSDLTHIIDFLDHNEFGLALETIIDEIESNNINLPKTSLELLKQAAELMDFPTASSTYWFDLLNLLNK